MGENRWLDWVSGGDCLTMGAAAGHVLDCPPQEGLSVNEDPSILIHCWTGVFTPRNMAASSHKLIPQSAVTSSQNYFYCLPDYSENLEITRAKTLKPIG